MTSLLTIELEGNPTVDKEGPFLVNFSGHEQISRLFSYQLEILWRNDNAGPSDMIGKKVSVGVARGDDDRWFSGYINRFAAAGSRGNYRVYRATMVPWLWFLTQTSDCKIFDRGDHSKDPTAEDVLRLVFDDQKYPNTRKVSFDLQGPHRKLEYCVQYRETDFNFVSRIMEQYGFYYFFKHSKTDHELVISNHAGGYGDCEEKKVDYPLDSTGFHKTDHITSWEHGYEFVPGKFAHTDYSFKDPASNLLRDVSNDEGVKSPGNQGSEIFDYPGEFYESGDGDNEAEIRMQEEEAGHNVVQSASTCKTFTPGCKFTLEGHHYDSENGEYVISSIHHSASDPGRHLTGNKADLTPSYTNTFSCLPSSVIFRPPRVTPKPVISGIQTAVVVGPKGEEIHTDKYGRVKVHFHWDRKNRPKRDDTVSCWIRVSHSVAGKKWGFMAIPRIGQEVVVEFIEGDPDRPLITGSVYNNDQMPHYSLPDEQTKTYVKTNSSKGGEGHNEIMFDDRAESEQVYVHAQKNMDVRVRNDSKERIYGNRHQVIGWQDDETGNKGGSQHEMVWQDKTLNTKRHHIEHIEGNWQFLIGAGEEPEGGNLAAIIEKQIQIAIGSNGLSVINEGSQRGEVQGDISSIVGGDQKEDIVGSLSLNLGGDQKMQLGGGYSLSAGGDLNEKIGGSGAIEAGQDIHIKAGMNMVLEAGMMLTLKVGGNFITLGPAGVDIMGTLVNINTAGSPGSGPGAQPQSPDAPEPPDTDVPEADPKTPSQALTSKTGMKSAP